MIDLEGKFYDGIWVFHGAGARFSSGVFTDVETADEWIAKHQLTGVLTKYPLDVGVYDWAVDVGIFEPKKEKEYSTKFIQGFTAASQAHHHYEDGKRLT